MANVNKTLLGVAVCPEFAAEEDRYVFTASPQTANLQQSEVRIECQTAGAGQTTIQLPEISEFEGKYQALKVIVIDSGGSASTAPITIFTGGTDTFSGGDENKIINTPEGAITLWVGDKDTWVV